MSDEPTGNLVIYQTEDGRARIECRLVDATVWLSQALLGELFDRSKKTISEHLRNLFEEGELDQDSVVRNFRTTAADGKSYDVAHYNLEAILAVGFRVKSPRGTQFRRWASTQLRELIVKGFSDELPALDPALWDYVIVHELLHFYVPNHGKLWKSLMRAHLGAYEVQALQLKRFAQRLEPAR